MADLNYGYVMSPEDEEDLRESMQEFAQLTTWRNTFAAQWEEVAALVAPNQVNTFYYGNFNWPGQKKTMAQIDATAMMAHHRFGAILDSLLTPRNMIWHGLAANNPDIMKQRDARLWYEEATRRLFKVRYSAVGNFASQNQQNFLQLGAFGTGVMFIDQAVDELSNPLRAIRYKSLPLGEAFLRENHQGLVDGVIRWFRLTAEQAFKKFGAEKLPATLYSALEQKSQTLFNFLHRVVPNTDYDPDKLDHRGKRFKSLYVCIEGQCIIGRGGYNVFPFACSRYDQAPGEVYGRSPAMMVLPAIKTLNAQKAVFLKQGHRAADPVLLTADDGVIDMSLRPGALNKGGVTADGRPLVHILPTGNIQVNEKMMEMEANLINDAFLVSLFQILTESPQMTATEVIERTTEKGILLAPTVGRQQSEYLGPLIHRELTLMASMGLLPPMPPILREANGDYEPVYTSPLSRAQRAQEVAGFMRTLETTLTIVNATQDPSMLDPFDFDIAVPAIAEIQAVPESWMADPKKIAAKRQARAQAAERQAQIQEAPAKAAMMKAQAAVQKSQGGGGQMAQNWQGGVRGGPQPQVPVGAPQ